MPRIAPKSSPLRMPSFLDLPTEPPRFQIIERLDPIDLVRLGQVECIEYAHLAPGGRYLIGSPRPHVGLWDLGPPYTRQADSALLDIMRYEVDHPGLVYHSISTLLPHSRRFLRFVGCPGRNQAQVFNE